MRFRVRNKSVATVIGNVEPLMSIGRPGVCCAGTGQQVPVRRAGRNPQAECSIDMNPCLVAFRDRYENLKPVECSNIQIAGLQHHDRGRVGLRG